MTVGELKRSLEAFDDELVVHVENRKGFHVPLKLVFDCDSYHITRPCLSLVPEES